ncbi:MAG: Uma2 family endonuclease [Tepidiformaceae bacterium]
MPVSEATYVQVALEDPEGRWELHCGELRRKPGMSQPHNTLQTWLSFHLMNVLPADQYQVAMAARARRDEAHYYIPDVMVIPIDAWRRFRCSYDLENYQDPLPLVVEVWSRSTGEYDVDEKLPEYQRRGDHEIWRPHPFDRTLTRWVRQQDGSYAESLLAGGTVALAAIPAASIDLDRLFARLDR